MGKWVGPRWGRTSTQRGAKHLPSKPTGAPPPHAPTAVAQHVAVGALVRGVAGPHRGAGQVRKAGHGRVQRNPCRGTNPNTRGPCPGCNTNSTHSSNGGRHGTRHWRHARGSQPCGGRRGHRGERGPAFKHRRGCSGCSGGPSGPCSSPCARQRTHEHATGRVHGCHPVKHSRGWGGGNGDGGTCAVASSSTP